MSEMSDQSFEINGVNGTGTNSEGASPGRVSPVRQRGPGRHPVTARMKWSKEVNKVVMECFYRSRPFDEEGKPIRGYRQRMFREWRERGNMELTEQRVCDQARAIRKNGWLSEVELEMIRRKIAEENDREDVVEEVRDEEESDVMHVNNDVSDHVVEEAGMDAENETVHNIVEDLTDDQQQIVERLRIIIDEDKTVDGICFKNIDKHRLKVQMNKVNDVIKFVNTNNVTETNRLIRAAAVWTSEQLGLKKKEFREKKDPWWKRRIEGDIKNLKKDVNLLDRSEKGELGQRKKGKLQKLHDKYRVKNKGIKTVIEEIKQRMIAKSEKIKRYEQRVKQFRLNRMFNNDQKKVYEELNGGKLRTNDVPGAEESRKFWGEIWTVEKEHNKGAEWLSELKKEINGEHIQEGLILSVEKVRKQARKMPNWKAPGNDGVQGYWIKNFTNLHERISEQLNDILSGNTNLPEWLTHGRTVLCQKDPRKGNVVENYRPITCLPLMWKLLTGMIADDMYGYMESENLLPDEQKGCRRKSRGTKDQLLIDKTILKDCRKRNTNLAMAWVDYKKAYDFVPHSWINECMAMFGIAENVRGFLKRSMAQWKLSLTSNGEELGDVNVRRGIFQGDSLSPLLFVLSMIPLSMLLRKVNVFYEWQKKEFKVNHLLFMDDLKLYAKNEEQIDSLIQTTNIFSTDIGMEFGIKKCGVLVLKRGKIIKCDGIELPSNEVIKQVEEDGYTYLGIVELDKIMENEMKQKTITEYKRRLRLILKSTLNGKNKMTAINTWAVAIFRYGAGILTWRESELKEVDRKTRKYLTMHGAMHPKSDVDRLYVKRCDGGRGLISVEECVKGEENNLGFYVANSEEMLIRGVCAAKTIETENTIDKVEFKKRRTEELKQKWTDKVMYGQFVRQMPEQVDKDKIWKWLSKGDLKVGTEALLCAAQEQAIRTNYVKHKIDRSVESPLCRLCGKRGETVQHVICECEKLAQKEYKRRHDNVAKKVHWDLCKLNGLEHAEKWYEHTPEGAIENEDVKILWDINIQCDNVIQARRPDLIVIDKKRKEACIVDIAVPADKRISEKEQEKIEKYQDLKREIKRLWKLRSVQVVPVVVGALGSVTKEFENWMRKLNIMPEVEILQKTALLGTARILRKVFEN